MSVKTLSVLLAATLLFTACSKSDDQADTAEPQAMSDIAYGTHAQQRMDVHLPAGRSAQTPLVIFLHGGGFVAGDKMEVRHVVDGLVAKGYAVVNANYRLIDAAGLLQTPVLHQLSAVKIVDQLADIKALVSKIATMAPGWGVSTSNWVLAGHSAGATLALLYAHGDGNSDQRIRAAMNFAGALSFAYSDESEVALVEPVLREVLYRATGVPATNANKLAYMAISPWWVTNNRAGAGVPVLNVRPEQDSGHELYVSYTQLLSSKGIANRYSIILGAGHGFEQAGKLQEAINVADGFLQENGF